LLKKMADRDARAKAGIENIGAGKDAGNHNTQS
jgi:hypothetical protein